ncbi:hypothetical protein BC831DRAFT_443995 [Entophlyctis helioformis]|nr:hypothetical protein BC831DRAFT_443995 [Entophlyctis helioformis]
MTAGEGPVKLSPVATIDASVDPYDRAAIIKSRDEFIREQLIRGQEVQVLRDKLRWCYYREGVNHFQNCRELAVQYLEVLRLSKEGRFIPYKAPKPEAPAAADE